MTNLFTNYLDATKVSDMACESIREAIATTVIANTAEKVRVDSAFFENLKAEAKKFAEATRIVLIHNGSVIKDVSFVGSAQQIRKKLQQLMKLVEEYDIWYEDICSTSAKDESFHGFCWGEGYFLGYPVPAASQPGDWDYAEIQETTSDSTDDTASDTTTSTYKADLTQIINAGAVWNTAYAAYERGIAFDIDTINQMVLDITLLKRVESKRYVPAVAGTYE